MISVKKSRIISNYLHILDFKNIRWYKSNFWKNVKEICYMILSTHDIFLAKIGLLEIAKY